MKTKHVQTSANEERVARAFKGVAADIDLLYETFKCCTIVGPFGDVEVSQLNVFNPNATLAIRVDLIFVFLTVQ